MQKVIEMKFYLYETFLRQAENHLECGNFRKAIKEYTKAIELIPDDWRAYYYRGRAYSNSMNYGQAISDYTRVIELKPDHTEAYIWRGVDLVELTHYEQAIEVCCQPDLF